MASASKTPNLNLPQWVGTEKPERTDFNAAFDAIDTTVASHLAESASKHIYESGTNPNGSYIKFDDGTMICRGRKTFTDVICNVPYEGGFRGSILNNIITFPASFVDNLISFVTLPAYAEPGVLLILTGTPAATQIPVAPFKLTSSATVTFSVSYIAIGRWK